MASTKPTFLLIHGAFGGPWVFDKLVPFIEQAGFATLRATFPSVNPEKPAEVTAQKDIEHVRNEYIIPLVEKEHKDLVIILHSYSGVVGSGAAFGFSKTDRKAKGLEGGVVGLVYIAANIVRENQTLIESAGGQWPPWIIKDKPHPYAGVIEPLIETLGHDCDPSLEPVIRAGAVPQGYLAFDTKSTAPCWAEEGYTGRLAYVRTSEDRINPLFAQDLWIEGTGVSWELVTIYTAHVPYLSQPEELAKHLIGFAEKFEAV